MCQRDCEFWNIIHSFSCHQAAPALEPWTSEMWWTCSEGMTIQMEAGTTMLPPMKRLWKGNQLTQPHNQPTPISSSQLPTQLQRNRLTKLRLRQVLAPSAHNRAWFGPKSQNHPKNKPLGWFKNPLLISFLLWFYGISGEDFAIGSFLQPLVD